MDTEDESYDRHELTNEGILFFEECFDRFSSDKKQLTEQEALELYRTAPYDPFCYNESSNSSITSTLQDDNFTSMPTIPSIDFYPISREKFLFMWRYEFLKKI